MHQMHILLISVTNKTASILTVHEGGMKVCIPLLTKTFVSEVCKLQKQKLCRFSGSTLCQNLSCSWTTSRQHGSILLLLLWWETLWLTSEQRLCLHWIGILLSLSHGLPCASSIKCTETNGGPWQMISVCKLEYAHMLSVLVAILHP